MKKRKKKRRSKKILVIIFVFLIVIVAGILIYLDYMKKDNTIKNEKKLVSEITSHYNTYVKTNKETILYNEKEEIVGKLGKDVELSLEEVTIDKNTKYFKIKNFDNYYIKFQDVDVIESLKVFDNRYKNYLLFNKNIVTKDVTKFYDDNNELVYEFNKSFNLPIIIRYDDKYGVEFNNRLLYVKTEDIVNVIDNSNEQREKANSIRVVAYHAFYDKDEPSEKWCRTSICHSTEQIEEHSKYISENSYFTLTMNELEMFIDGKINIPKKSVVITIDDGLLAERGIAILAKYKLNATVFLITSYYTPSNYVEYEYIEFHSHGHNIHNVGQCPGGQGGGIKCLNKTDLLNDLNTSRGLLNNSTVFCYPFYEYNDYAISVLKESGFTMAFAGFLGDGRVRVNTNKYLIPRYTIYNDTTVNEFANIIK